MTLRVAGRHHPPPRPGTDAARLAAVRTRLRACLDAGELSEQALANFMALLPYAVPRRPAGWRRGR